MQGTRGTTPTRRDGSPEEPIAPAEPLGSEAWADPGSHRSVIAEKKFAQLLSEQLGDSLCLLATDEGRMGPSSWLHLVERAHELACFLDDHGARYNRRFALLSELVSVVVCLGKAGQVAHHVRLRLPQYHLAWPRGQERRLRQELAEALAFTGACVDRVRRRIGDELDMLGVELAREPLALPTGAPRAKSLNLPHDHDVTEDLDDELPLARLLGSYTNVAASVRSLAAQAAEVGTRRDNGASLSTFVDRAFDEGHARELEGRLHNLQSAYDTDVRFTPLERRHPRLRSWRGHVSLCRHLAEIATHLVHFHERHESAIHHAPARDTMVELIDREEVLRLIAHFSLFWIGRAMELATPLNESLFEHLVGRRTVELSLPEGVFLHARPLGNIVRTVTTHGTPVEMEIAGERAPASSLLGLLLLAGQHPDEKKIRFHGDAPALEELRKLFEAGLGELD